MKLRETPERIYWCHECNGGVGLWGLDNDRPPPRCPDCHKDDFDETKFVPCQKQTTNPELEEKVKQLQGEVDHLPRANKQRLHRKATQLRAERDALKEQVKRLQEGIREDAEFSLAEEARLKAEIKRWRLGVRRLWPRWNGDLKSLEKNPMTGKFYQNTQYHEPRVGNTYVLLITPAWEEVDEVWRARKGEEVKVIEVKPGKIDEARFLVQAPGGAETWVPLVFLVDLNA